MIVRPAVPGDVVAIGSVLEASDESDRWPDVPGSPYVEHLLARPGTRVVVGEFEGTVAGMAGSIEVGGPGRRFLSDLYVHPTRQGRGLGTAMLRETLADVGERMTFSSGDPRALAAYVRAGMRPWWPLLYLVIEVGRLGPHDSGVAWRPADVAETARLSHVWTGVDRTADFEHYARLPDASGFAVLIDDAIAAVGWARRERIASDGRWLDHASIAPGADAVRAAFGLLRVAAGNDRLGAAVPGPHPAMASLFDHGVRFDGIDTFCATEPTLLDPARIFPNPSLL
jgi:GNAT superfamily N-acetyltransferase